MLDRREFPPNYNKWVEAAYFHESRRRLQDTASIRQVNGKPFKSEKGAKAIIDHYSLADTHKVARTEGGFVLARMSLAEQAELKRIASGQESYMEAQQAVLDEMGLAANEHGEYDLTNAQWAEVDQRVDVRLGRRKRDETREKQNKATVLKTGNQITLFD